MHFFILNIPLIKVQNRHLFDTVRPFKEVPMWSTGREVTQDSGSAWVRTEGMRRITEEENGVGRSKVKQKATGSLSLWPLSS